MSDLVIIARIETVRFREITRTSGFVEVHLESMGEGPVLKGRYLYNLGCEEGRKAFDRLSEKVKGKPVNRDAANEDALQYRNSYNCGDLRLSYTLVLVRIPSMSASEQPIEILGPFCESEGQNWLDGSHWQNRVGEVFQGVFFNEWGDTVTWCLDPTLNDLREASLYNYSWQCHFPKPTQNAELEVEQSSWRLGIHGSGNYSFYIPDQGTRVFKVTMCHHSCYTDKESGEYNIESFEIADHIQITGVAPSRCYLEC